MKISIIAIIIAVIAIAISIFTGVMQLNDDVDAGTWNVEDTSSQLVFHGDESTVKVCANEDNTCTVEISYLKDGLNSAALSPGSCMTLEVVDRVEVRNSGYEETDDDVCKGTYIIDR